MSKIDEIYANVLPEMAAQGIEDTTANRLAFLQGVRDAWMEDDSKSFEKSLYMMAISTEIFKLSLRMIRV